MKQLNAQQQAPADESMGNEPSDADARCLDESAGIPRRKSRPVALVGSDRARGFSVAAGAVAVLVGSAALIGWASDIAMLKSIRPDWVAMKPNTAICFILIGLASLPAVRERSVDGGPPVLFLAGRLCGWLAGLIGLLSLAEYAFDWNPGLDQWLFPEPAGTVGTSHPGRMAPDTAICFALLAVGLEFVSLARQTTQKTVVAALLGALVVTIALVEILSYFAPDLRTSGWGGWTMMALPTATVFVVLGAAVSGLALGRGQSGPVDSTNPFDATATAVIAKFGLTFAILAIGITAAGAFYYRSYEREFRIGIEARLSAIADLKVSQLVAWRRERLADGGVLYQNPSFSGLVEHFLRQPVANDAGHELQVWLQKYPRHYGYDQIQLIDASGAVRLSLPAGSSPASDIMLARAVEVLRLGRPDILGFYRNENDHRIYLQVLVPLYDNSDDHRPLGVVSLRVDPTQFLHPFIQGWPVPSQTSETLLVRREGTEVIFLNDLRFHHDAALNMRGSLDNRDLPATRAVLGETGIMEGKDYRDVPVLAALRGIPDSPWFMVAKVDQMEAYAPIRGHLWKVVVTVMIFVFGAGAAVSLIWRGQRMRFFQKQAQSAEALLREKQNLEALFASSPVAMFILDAKVQIVRVNAAALALAQATREQVLDHAPGNVLSCVHSREDPRGCGFAQACRVCATRSSIEGLLARGGNLHGVELPLELVRQGRTERVWMKIGAESIQLDGRPHLMVAMDDTTERKTAEEKIRQLNASLEQRVQARTAELAAANQELEAFSYSVSHDLRAPLRSIDGFSRILLEDYGAKLDAEGRDSFDRIRAAAQRMSGLIEDLLKLSRITRTELIHTRVDLSALAREVLCELRGHASGRSVECQVAEGLVTEGDPGLLRDVLDNLLGNAWKFTGRSASPRIEVGVIPAAEPVTGSAPPVFFVRDNGAGFDEAYAGKLFGAFQRLHTTEQFTGTGIGLASVQRIIRRHGGRIWAEAKVDQGATFFFTLQPAGASEAS